MGKVNVSGGGKRFAEGTGTTPTNGQLSVSGLAFQPKYIIVEQQYSTNYYSASYCADTMNSVLNNCRENYEGSYGGGPLTAGFSVNASGFTVTLINLGVAFNYKWRAFE